MFVNDFRRALVARAGDIDGAATGASTHRPTVGVGAGAA